jgi:dimeric dUTPase (all-alpha-NTP-PPase superfamily)
MDSTPRVLEKLTLSSAMTQINEVIRGIFRSVEEFKKGRNTIEYMTYFLKHNVVE